MAAFVIDTLAVSMFASSSRRFIFRVLRHAASRKLGIRSPIGVSFKSEM